MQKWDEQIVKKELLESPVDFSSRNAKLTYVFANKFNS